MGTAMEGFFDGADMVFEAVTLAPPTTAQGVPAEASILSTEPVPIGEGTYTKGISKTTLIPTKTLTLQEIAPIPSTEPVPIGKGTYMKGISETAPIPVETLTPQEGVVPPAVVQTEVASPATPLVISTSDPFATLSQVVKDGSSLVVTLSSIPSSATHGPNANLSSEGS